MKKIEFQKNKTFIIDAKSKKHFITNPKKLFIRKSNEKKFNNTAFFDYNNPYLNNSLNKIDLKENSILVHRINKINTPKKIFTKISGYKSKINRNRPHSSNVKSLPKLIKTNSNNIFPSFIPINFLNLETEKLNQEKYQLNKLVKKLEKDLILLKKQNVEKDELLNKKEKEINDLIITNNIILDEDNENKYNYLNNNSYINENKIYNLQNNSSFNLYLKIKKEIKNYNNEIKIEEEKINELKHSNLYTKTYECFIEKNLLELQIKKISSLLNNALMIKENNEKKIEELYYLEKKINVQGNILKELKKKQAYLDEDQDSLEKEINNIKYIFIINKEKVDKNKKEIKFLIKKNNILEKNDQTIKLNFVSPKNGKKANSLYLKKITDLKKNVYFFKKQNIYNETIINKLKEQKKNVLESLNYSQNLKISPSFLSLTQINNKEKLLNKENNIGKVEKQNIKEEEKNENNMYKNIKMLTDEQTINDLQITYKKLKEKEKLVEKKYNESKEKIRQINEYIQQEQNINNGNNINIEGENDINQIEFGIDEDNPYYTDSEENQPEITNKFTSTQFNQFTYVLFKNFEAKGVVSDESKNKIIEPFLKIVDDNKIDFVEYPSKQFEFIVEAFTKIILNSINSDNEFNHSLTKIFISALLINSGCFTKKLIEYFNILFSYTRDYLIEEDKYLMKLKSKYSKSIIYLIDCINNYLKNENKKEKLKDYFPLIIIKEIIEGNNIQLKDKYVEFLFYYLKKYNDTNAKLDELKYSLLNDFLDKDNANQVSKRVIEANQKDEINNKSNFNIITNKEKKNESKTINNKDTQENQNSNEINNEIIINNDSNNKIINLSDNNNFNEHPNLSDNKEIIKDTNLSYSNTDINKVKNNKKERKEEKNSKMEDSMTEITNEEYIKQINDAIKIMKKQFKEKNPNFLEFMEYIKQDIQLDNKAIECFTIYGFNEKLKEIAILFSNLKLSCICSKYSLPNELRIIEVKNMIQDFNSDD